MDESPPFEWIDTPASSPDMYAAYWRVTQDDGRVSTVATRFTGTVLSTDEHCLPDRVAEAIRTHGRSEIERHLHAIGVLESIEVREHEPNRPLLRFSWVEGVYI